jgi:NAD(P)-dependent dehydrogenase (short-subunit alcohol dehydrogenase family)
MATYDVHNRSAIVTGAGSGIGKAVALLLGANGASVIVVDRDPVGVETVVEEIRAAGGVAAPLVGDVTDPALSRAAVDDANALAPLRVAVNNAGIGGESAEIGDFTLDGWRTIISVNLDSVFYGLKAQLPAIAENGGGSIVNMASILGSVGFPNSSGYVTAKHGILGLTQNAALEYALRKVRVTAVGPGFIRTPLVADALDAATLSLLEGRHALGRLGEADEVASLVAFLASDAATFITGSYHLVDGGYTAQ